jgi:hypothetical protein
VDEIRNYERGRFMTATEAAHRLLGKSISQKSPGVTRLPVHLPNQQYCQMARRDGLQSNATLLMRYIDRPRDPRLDNITYIRFAEVCRLVKHRPDQPIQPLEILETRIAGRPQMRIRFYGADHVSCVRMQNVAPQHGDVFYLRCILAHRPVLSWIDARTTNGTIYGTYQEAARAMGIFSSNNEGEMAFTELVELGVSPAHLRWMYCVLAAEGSPMLRRWERHQSALGGDLRDRALRTGAVTNPVILRNQVLEQLQDVLGNLGRRLRDIGLPEPVGRQREVDVELNMWGGDPEDLHSFEASLTVDQVCKKYLLYILCLQLHICSDVSMIVFAKLQQWKTPHRFT